MVLKYQQVMRINLQKYLERINQDLEEKVGCFHLAIHQYSLICQAIKESFYHLWICSFQFSIQRAQKKKDDKHLQETRDVIFKTLQDLSRQRAKLEEFNNRAAQARAEHLEAQAKQEEMKMELSHTKREKSNIEAIGESCHLLVNQVAWFLLNSINISQVSIMPLCQHQSGTEVFCSES